MLIAVIEEKNSGRGNNKESLWKWQLKTVMMMMMMMMMMLKGSNTNYTKKR